MFVKSLSDSKRIIKKFKPDIVIGTGGYVSGSVVLRASKMGIKTCIHEQNSFPGITNKMLAKNVDFVMTSFEDSHKRFAEIVSTKLRLTGNPIRDDILKNSKEDARNKLGIPQDEKMILVSGGSGGSEEINDALKIALPKMVESGITFMIATGRVYYDKFMKDYGHLKMGKNQKIVPYLDDMANNLVAADLTICSAGAISLAEVTAVGVPAIVIPKAYTAENHQEYNAKSLEVAGGGICITESDLSPESLDKAIFSLIGDKDRLSEMSKASKRFGKPDALEIIYRHIENALNK